jgi:hypothetical protein
MTKKCNYNNKPRNEGMTKFRNTNNLKTYTNKAHIFSATKI